MTLFVSWERVAGYWTPTRDMVESLEARLRSALEHAREVPESLDRLCKGHPQRAAYVSREIGGILARLGEYRRQYIGVVLVGGRRRILVNCFPGSGTDSDDSYGYWKAQWVLVDDGGNWYWRIQYDAERNEFAEFDSNGNA